MSDVLEDSPATLEFTRLPVGSYHIDFFAEAAGSRLRCRTSRS